MYHAAKTKAFSAAHAFAVKHSNDIQSRTAIQWTPLNMPALGGDNFGMTTDINRQTSRVLSDIFRHGVEDILCHSVGKLDPSITEAMVQRTIRSK